MTWCRLKVCVCRLDHPVWTIDMRAPVMILCGEPPPWSLYQAECVVGWTQISKCCQTSNMFLLQLFLSICVETKIAKKEKHVSKIIELKWHILQHDYRCFDCVITRGNGVLRAVTQLCHNANTCRVWSCISVHHMYKAQGELLQHWKCGITVWSPENWAIITSFMQICVSGLKDVTDCR